MPRFRQDVLDWIEWRAQRKDWILSDSSILFKPIEFIKLVSRVHPWTLWKKLFASERWSKDKVINWPQNFPTVREWWTPVSLSLNFCLVKIKEHFIPRANITFGELSQYQLLFKENSVCKFVGLLPWKISSAFCEVNSNASFFERFILEKKREDLLELINQDRVVVHGGMSSILEALRTMSTDSPRKFSLDQLIEGVEKRVDRIKLPYLGCIQSLNLDEVRINPDSYSGFLSDLISGRTRKESFAFSRVVAKELFLTTLKKKISSMDIWVFGTRPKAADLSWSEKPLKARPIALCDGVLNLVASVSSQKITSHLVRLPHSELFTGRSLSRKDLDFLSKYLGERDGCLYFSPDWSQFDNHVYEELIVVAGLLLKQCFRQSIGCNNYFSYIITSIIDKTVAIDPGVLYKISKGLPSGHPYTTLIGTVINWVVWSTIINEYSKLKGGEIDDRFALVVSGDDTLLRTPCDLDEDLFWKVIESSGLVCDSLVSKGTGFWSYGAVKGAHLLRRHFIPDYSTSWDEKYLYSRLMYHEDKDWTLVNAIEQASDYLIQSPGFTRVHETLREYINFLYEKLSIKNNQYSLEMALGHAELHTDTIPDKLNFSRILDYLELTHRTYQAKLKHKGKIYSYKCPFFLSRKWCFQGVKKLLKRVRFKLSEEDLLLLRNENKLVYEYCLRSV